VEAKDVYNLKVWAGDTDSGHKCNHNSLEGIRHLNKYE